MNFKSLNSAILSVTNPQPKNEALTSLQENRDLLNAVLPYTIGLQSVIVLVMIEALLDGSGPISGTVSLFKNLMKKWKARVLGGQLSADEAQSFIAEYEKLSASLPTGKRNFLKASFNKMEQAAKAGDKGKLGAIATEVKDYLARNSAEVKEDYQTRERDRQMANTGQLGSSLDSKEKASKKVYGKDGRVEHKSLRAMIKKANWKDEKNRLAVKEDLRKWFSKTDPEGDWQRINSKGEAVGPCARAPGEPKPKCMSKSKRASLSKRERANAVRTKRKHDANPDRTGAPISVSNYGRGKISENATSLEEKNIPTSPEKWSRAKALARSKFKVYPSAYANGWASKKYKAMGGGWRTE